MILLAIAEAAYVLSRHGRRGLQHGLPFLTALAALEGVNPLPYRAPEEGQKPPGYTKAREASSPARRAGRSTRPRSSAMRPPENYP